MTHTPDGRPTNPVTAGTSDASSFVELAAIADREDRVCVLNILGTESRSVTPVGHVLSGGNVVFGTSLGRSGDTLATQLGQIPVFSTVAEGLAAGLSFNTGVIYLPPSGVLAGVLELLSAGASLRKIVIVTEKVPLRDARLIRAHARRAGIMVIGCGSLGVADSWHRVRIGGALGGSDPSQILHRGSVAIYSNSGSFTTTIAEYLSMAGWGTTTLISSGKDVYIQYAAADFVDAFNRDARSKAAVMYVEPGGYYEDNLRLEKPLIACVVGHWKTALNQPVGHAGALVGRGDDAASKERWFFKALDVDRMFTTTDPACSHRGAVVNDIAHIGPALSAVMRLRGQGTDFPPRGDLSLKPWFAGDGQIAIDPALRLRPVTAPAPYGDRIDRLRTRIGTVPARQTMRNRSGASRLDPATDTASLHGCTVLDAAGFSYESNLLFALLKHRPDAEMESLTNLAIAANATHCDPAILRAVSLAKDAGGSPNVLLSVAAAMSGPARYAHQSELVERLLGILEKDGPPSAESPQHRAPGRPDRQNMATLLQTLVATGADVGRLTALIRLTEEDTTNAVLAGIYAVLGWPLLSRRQVSKATIIRLPWHFGLIGTMLAAAGAIASPDLIAVDTDPLVQSASRLAATALLGHLPAADDVDTISLLLGLLMTNGPGAISAQGAKGAVSADGPQDWRRVQINKAYAGYLTHTGFSHGGNGFAAIRFLVDCFAGINIEDPGRLDLRDLAAKRADEYASDYAALKARSRAEDSPVAPIPGISHPVFRDKDVNIDPRAQFVWDRLVIGGRYNLFHDFYRQLVVALHHHGVTRNILCVNVDAVIAAHLLSMVWPRYRSGTATMADLENAAFMLFLLARLTGTAAEIDDHMNRGRDMDMRVPAGECSFVA